MGGTHQIWIVYDCFAKIKLTVNRRPILCIANAVLYWFLHHHRTTQLYAKYPSYIQLHDYPSYVMVYGMDIYTI